MTEEWRNRIIVDPKVLVGKPIIKGTRISVELILDLLANVGQLKQYYRTILNSGKET